MLQIIPAILATTEEDLERDISRYRKSLLFQEGWIHIDFMDNKFVPNHSIGPSVIAKHPINLHKEAHIMVAHPMEWIDDLENAGFERVIFHIEVKKDVEQCIDCVKAKGLEVGFAINNTTPIAAMKPYLDKLDVILVMGVVPGFQGQKFIPETINKIQDIHRLRSQGNYNFKIGVDGAVKDDNIKDIAEAGVDFAVVGSYLLKGDIDENLERLWEILQ